MSWMAIYLISVVALHTIAQLCVLVGLFDEQGTKEGTGE